MGETEKKEKKRKKEKKKDKVDSPDSDVEVQKEDENSKKKSKKKLKKEKRKLQEEDNASEETSEKENTEKNSKKKKKNNKRKRDEEMEVDEDESSPKKTKFDWDEVITSLLMKKDDKEMKLNKLKKKCLSEFFSSNEGTHKTQEEVGAKFDKKLKKRKYRLPKGRVKLIVDDEPEEKIISEKPEPVIKKETKPAM